jgi:hypothetical protein
MNFFERLMLLDRRWVYLFLFVIVTLAYLFRNDFRVPVTVTSEVKSIYDYIEALKPGDKILMSFDYDPNSLAELHPMARAILLHAMRKDVKVIGVTLSQYGATMVEGLLRDAEQNARDLYGLEKVYGVDYCFLGYRPYPALVILGMGQNFRIYFPQDYYGTDLNDLEIMDRTRNYDDVKCVLVLTSGTTGDWWIVYGNAKYNMPLALGVTGVMASDFYPYLGNAIFGLLGGWKGAAEYEKLVEEQHDATAGMPSQVAAHLTIILFIVIGNLGYHFGGRKKPKLDV